MTFQIADGLNLPANAVTQTFALLGRRGSGKSYAAGKLAEALLDGGAQVVVVDPVGVWYGLRLDARGDTAGGISIPVFGGLRGDIPLEATAGKLVAQLVAEKRTSVVLDVSGFTGADQRRFVADFATELLELKKAARSPVMLMFDEAQEFVPQHVRPDHARMVGAMEKLVKLGRNFGVGVTLLSQRPQAVNKDVLNQTEVLMVFQLTGPQERKVIEGWVSDNGFGQKELAELPRLQPGHAFLWSPQWLGKFARVGIGRKRTFDASATPDAGGAPSGEPLGLGPINLDEVRAAMAATIEEAKANDPKVLREEVARLREAMNSKYWERVRDDNTAMREEIKRLRAQQQTIPPGTRINLREIDDQLAALQAEMVQIAGMVDVARSAASEVSRLLDPNPLAGPPPRTFAEAASVPAPREARAPAPSLDDIGKAGRLILAALAARHPTPLTKAQVATLAGYAPNGGGFNNAIGALKTRGLVERDGDSFALTRAGLAAAPTGERPQSPGDLVNLWCSKLPGRAKDMLRAIVQRRAAMTKEELAAAVQMDASGGGFNNYMGMLRSNGLIQKARGGFEAASSLVQR